MGRIVVGALVAIVMLGAATAQACQRVTGWIIHVNRQNDTLTLASGTVVLVSGDISMQALREGVRVRLVVQQTRYGPEAVAIAPARSRRTPAGKRNTSRPYPMLRNQRFRRIYVAHERPARQVVFR